MRSRQAGFTLVEIAIVLVIIGLLLGGVLKGQELINSAKVKNLAQDFRAISTFVYAYQDRFRALPGDDAAADKHVGGEVATTPTGGTVGRIDGNWNSTTKTDESFLFWQHVRMANLATGTTDKTSSEYLPRNAEGGAIGITGTSPYTGTPAWAGNFFVCSSGIQGRFVRQIDTTIDDGDTQTGTVRAFPNDTASSASFKDVTVNDDATQFTVCSAF